MRIIHLILGKANPDRMNGVNKLVFEMVSTQQELGYEVCLWGITKEPSHNYPNRNFKTELFQMLSNKFTIHADLKKAIDDLPKETVFHIHGSFIPEFYHIGKQLTKQNIPYMYTPHGALAPAALARRGWKKQIYFKLFEQHLLKNAACMIATGLSVYNHANTLVRLQRRVLIPNGQPLIKKMEKAKRETEMIFGFCGRIALEHKGLDLLLQGFKIYKDQGGKAVLHLIGDGPEMPKFKKMAKDLGVFNELTLYGAQFGKDKFDLLSKFDVFVHTSRMEGFPAAVLEATATGTPVLISKATNVWNYISKYDCGLLIDPNIPENIAGKMFEYELLYKKGKLEQMGADAQRMITEIFDWKVICRKLYAEYESASRIQARATELLSLNS